MKKLFITACFAFVLLSCGSTQPKTDSAEATATVKTLRPVDPTVYGNTITSTDLKEMLYKYASDEFEGRDTGAPGQKKAVEYLKQKYVSMGIPSPLSGDDYFQEVPLQKQGIPTASMSVNDKTYNNFESLLALSVGESDSFAANDIIYAGYGIEDETYSDYKDLDVKGKIVLIKAGEPTKADGTYVISGTTEPTKWTNGRQAMVSKREVAIEKGVKALIYMDNTSFNMYSQYLSNAAKSGAGGRLSLKDDSDDMNIFMVNDALGKALYPDIDTNDSPKVVPVTLEVDIASKTENLNSENVVAFIKGSEKPDEIIIISAHLDHLGTSNGEIYNGADDDGSGTVAVVEIAKAFKKAADEGHGPKRSILFLHVTGEEKGLLGSRYYTDVDPIFPLANTVVDLNIDMIGRVDDDHLDNRNYVYLIGSDKLSTELHQISEDANAKYANITLDYKYNDENDPNRFYYRSDHYNFAKNNIPVIFYFNGTHADYHKPTDTPDKIQYDLLQNRARLVFYTAWELANRDKRIIVDKAEE